ncbi:DUF1479 domain protein [Xylariaceae sp. FL0804]|nr:DUF1479 domain protein [Xylariaceae sp. FL0804]
MNPSQPQFEGKREGDISDAFVSLSGNDRPPLPERFLHIKRALVEGHEDRVIDSWQRLLEQLRIENEIIAREGPGIIPSIDFERLGDDLPKLRAEIKKRGVAVIRGVIPEDEARHYKDELEEYVRQNPSTKAFPPDNPQVFELYWSGPQVKARAHPNFLAAQTALMSSLWHCGGDAAAAAVATSQPLAYADRLRIRQPGDATFALGPHVDGGSVERWEPHGYGRGGVYDGVFAGRALWGDSSSDDGGEDGSGSSGFDPWDAGRRVPVIMDNYDGLGACSMFRMFQGWLSMSRTRPREGTLLVCPLLRLATAYMLLRPFFHPVRPAADFFDEDAEDAGESLFLAPENWRFAAGDEMTSELQGATPGHGQELDARLHPHLELARTMVHVPEVKPGDLVVWHCDTIHAVDKVHEGRSDSSVLYIPICPVTEQNARYLRRQREAFLAGAPGPDFPGGRGEAGHVGRPTEDYLRAHSGAEGLRALGFEKLVAAESDGKGAREVMVKANEILGF